MAYLLKCLRINYQVTRQRLHRHRSFLSETKDMAEEHWQCGKTILESIEYMFTSKRGSDVTFLVGEDKKKLLAHKFILVSRSPVFYAMLEGQLAERDDIHITDISEDIFYIFLRYLYTDAIDINIRNIAAVLNVSKKYFVDTLTKKCEEFLTENMTPANVCLLMEKIHEFPDDKLEEEINRMIEENSPEILQSDMFVELCCACVHRLISSDDLQVDEKHVFEAVIRWAGAECERQSLEITDANRRNVLGDILFDVRFPLIDADFFCDTVFKYSILSNDELVNIHRFIHLQERDYAQLKKFNCNCRAGCRRGSYTLVSRQQSGRLSFDPTFKEVPCDVYFKSSSDVYLHGIKTVQDMDTVQVTIKDDQGKRVYFDTHCCSGGQTDEVKFRKILRINSQVEYNISLSSTVKQHAKASFGNNLIFDDVHIQLRSSGSEFGIPYCSTYLCGFLLSK